MEGRGASSVGGVEKPDVGLERGRFARLDFGRGSEADPGSRRFAAHLGLVAEVAVLVESKRRLGWHKRSWTGG